MYNISNLKWKAIYEMFFWESNQKGQKVIMKTDLFTLLSWNTTRQAQ